MRSGRIITFLGAAAALALLPLSSATLLAQRAGDRSGSNAFLTDPAYEKVVVAEVGGMKITAQEFLLSYEFGPAFTKRRKDSKRRYLNFMINEKLFALEGYARGLERSESAREALAEVEGDLASEELYKLDVAKNVSVTRQDIDAGMRKKRVSVALRWLFAGTESGIAAYERLLRKGAAFDSVFALQFRDSARTEERSLRTTLFDLQMKNPVLAKIVDSLGASAVSLPIRVDDGWYIVQVAERDASPIVAETEAWKQREDVHRALVERASDRLSDRYVNQLVVDAKPTIERRAFDVVQTYLASGAVPRAQFAQWDMAGLLAKKWGPIDWTDIGPFKTQPIVTYKQGKLSVGDFLRWYEARSAALRLPATSPRAFFASLEGYVWRMVRDKLLVERSFKRRLQLTSAVLKQKKWWEEKILFDLETSAIRDSVPRDTALLRAYYVRNARDFRDSTGRTRPYEAVADDVLRSYYASALTERMLHRILALKARHGVKIYESALDRLSVESENDPGAIDVYAVKKGGTFPRPAFPVIDLGWQEWN